MSIGLNEDVGRFDIAVNDFSRVETFEGYDLKNIKRCEWAFREDGVFSDLPVQQYRIVLQPRQMFAVALSVKRGRHQEHIPAKNASELAFPLSIAHKLLGRLPKQDKSFLYHSKSQQGVRQTHRSPWSKTNEYSFP